MGHPAAQLAALNWPHLGSKGLTDEWNQDSEADWPSLVQVPGCSPISSGLGHNHRSSLAPEGASWTWRSQSCWAGGPGQALGLLG